MKLTVTAALCLALLAAPAASRPTRDQIYDQFTFDMSCFDLAARLDNLANELSRPGNPGVKAYVRVYAGREVRRGEAQFYVDLIKNYLVERRGVSARRFEVIFSGYREEAGADVNIAASGGDIGPMRTLELKDVVFRKEIFKTGKYACAKTPRRRQL